MAASGTQLGIYRLIEKIGAGGMGEVWKAEDTRLGRTVAVKILPGAVARDHDAIARMRREARTAAQLNHPNIATIHAFEEAEQLTYIVMEYVDGEPLTHVIRRRRMAEADLCRIARNVADALAEAHAKGVVHRDIKPDNIMVRGTRVKVLDFGIAKQVGEQIARSDDPTAYVTQQGLIVGTVYYMSPEQALGKQLDARTDLFSLGVVLYEAATGRLPFHGETVTETITQIIRDEPAAPARVNPSISPGLDRIIRRCLQKNREDRYKNAEELVAALDAQLSIAPTAPMTQPADVSPYAATEVHTTAPPTVVERPRRGAVWPWIAAMVVLVAIGGAAAAFLLREPQPVVTQAAAKPAAAKPAATTTTQAPAQVAAAAPPPQPATTSVDVTAPPAVAAVAPSKPAAPPPRSADDFYNDGMERMRDRDLLGAATAFQQAVALDPHHARSHFRLGIIAMMERHAAVARRELLLAMEDRDRLDSREQTIAELSLAMLNGNRQRARHLLDTLPPDDPELEPLRRALGEEGDPLPPPRPFRRRRP